MDCLYAFVTKQNTEIKFIYYKLLETYIVLKLESCSRGDGVLVWGGSTTKTCLKTGETEFRPEKY